MDLDSRVAIVGPNGTGKSTLLKLMTGDLEALDGMVKRHNHLKLGMYHQHLTELLDPKLTPLEYMVSSHPPCQRQHGRDNGAEGPCDFTGNRRPSVLCSPRKLGQLPRHAHRCCALL